MFKFFRYCFFSFLLFAVLVGAVCAGGLYYLVVVNPGSEIEEAHINDILGRESPVYYRDGQTKIGVLFEGVHRQYLTYKQIPKSFVDSLIAAEDDQFFDHFGLDIPGIIRAAMVNFQAGKIVQGGSTITQQTAKNLFKRESRSLQAKIKELLFALRLEHKYPKEKILEFYTNQFFVSGNGHGLGVAARYFFDKTPQDLTLVESAFIAGSVKRPNYYNPFLKKNSENNEQVKQRVKERTNYVLGKMLKAKKISEQEYNTAKATEIVFKQGKMTFAQNTVMDLVKEGVGASFIAETLEANGISNISTSGAKVITSLDPRLQEKTVYALRRQLSWLDTMLRGYNRAQVQEEYKSLDFAGDTELQPGAFVFGTISEVAEIQGKGVAIQIQFAETASKGLLDEKGLVHLVNALTRSRRGSWATPGPADRKELLRALLPGDKVCVSLRASDGAGNFLVDLERYPKVEGGAIVLQEGAIRALSGGMSNQNFNRATSARRLMGSTFKPFLFAAAFQLGWNPVDMLANRKGDVFAFMNQAYSPQPDHDSPFSSVSLSWAGVTSENVAAVWLLYHLTDHLSPQRTQELAVQLDMAPRTENGKTEDYKHYKQRMRDNYGIVVNRDYLEQAAFNSAVKALKPDFLFDNQTDDYKQLQQLRYESGYLALRNMLSTYLAYARAMQHLIGRVDPDSMFDYPQRAPVSVPGRMARDSVGRFIYTLRQDLPPNWTEIGIGEIMEELKSTGPDHAQTFWQQQVKLDGVTSVNNLQLIEDQLRSERGKYVVNQPYTLEILSEVKEFRIMLGLQYLVRLAKACGIDSPFEPVLSLPLGSNVVTLAEITRVYETLITGSRHDDADAGILALAELDGHADRDGSSIIERIETPEGRTVYSRQAYKTQVFDPLTAAAVSNVLQNVVPYGTGKYAWEHVRLHSDDPERAKTFASMNMPYPLLGKTGTSNDYRNAAFIGYVPVLTPDNQAVLGLQGGYTVGVYTGFDDNQSMVKGPNKVSGSVGALPAWSDIAQALIDTEKIGDRIDMVDLAFNGLALQYPEAGQVFVPVDPQAGGAMARGGQSLRQPVAPAGPSSLSFGAINDNGRFEPERRFVPLPMLH